jgi:hypothetical protein
MLCGDLRRVASDWLPVGAVAALGAIVRRDGCSRVQGADLERQPTLRQHPVDAGQPDSSSVSEAQ